MFFSLLRRTKRGDVADVIHGNNAHANTSGLSTIGQGGGHGGGGSGNTKGRKRPGRTTAAAYIPGLILHSIHLIDVAGKLSGNEGKLCNPFHV